MPKQTEVTISDGIISVKGPKGILTKPLHQLIKVEVQEEGVQVSQRIQNLESRALVGTYASHMRNMLAGVTVGFTKKLLVEGVGFKWDVSGKTLNLALGFSHPIKMAIPEGLAVSAERGTLTISGFDKELVGQFAANVRAYKKPEPYKGKGIRYEGEVIRRKVGKKL